MKLVLPDRLPTSCFPPILFNRFFPRGAVADDLKRKLRVLVETNATCSSGFSRVSASNNEWTRVWTSRELSPPGYRWRISQPGGCVK